MTGPQVDVLVSVASKDTTRSYINQIQIKYDDQVRAASTDGHRLLLMYAKTPDETTRGLEVCYPVGALVSAIKMAKSLKTPKHTIWISLERDRIVLARYSKDYAVPLEHWFAPEDILANLPAPHDPHGSNFPNLTGILADIERDRKYAKEQKLPAKRVPFNPAYFGVMQDFNRAYVDFLRGVGAWIVDPLVSSFDPTVWRPDLYESSGLNVIYVLMPVRVKGIEDENENEG